MDDNDRFKILIMMEEYKSLRAELLQRNTVLNSIFAVCGTVFAGAVGVLAQYGLKALPGTITVSVMVLGFVVFTWLEIHREAKRVGAYLGALEKEVNERTKDRLLGWESTHGLPVAGYMWIGKQPPT